MGVAHTGYILIITIYGINFQLVPNAAYYLLYKLYALVIKAKSNSVSAPENESQRLVTSTNIAQ